MPQENLGNLVRSWNLMQGWATGPVLEDKLSPETYGRIRTLYNHSWREEQLSPNFDWGVQNFSVYLPESLYVVSSIYLKVELPAISGANFKDYPGLYVIKSLRIMSNGTEVYTCDCNLFFHDYLESLSEEALLVFGDTYLGHVEPAAATARTVMIPIMLPNSSYNGRAGGKGHGIFPCFLGQSRLELQFTLNTAKFTSADAANFPASISGACSLMYHQVEMSEAARTSYSDLRGAYSIVNRRFTELTSGWQLGAANTAIHVNQFQPQGTVTQLMVIGVTDNEDESRHTQDYILPTKIKVTADSIVVRDLDTASKVKAELWTNGFIPNKEFPGPGRMCFAAHCAQSDHVFSGGYNMTNASNVDFEFQFPVAVRYRVIAAQIQRVSIDALGVIRARLD